MQRQAEVITYEGDPTRYIHCLWADDEEELCDNYPEICKVVMSDFLPKDISLDITILCKIKKPQTADLFRYHKAKQMYSISFKNLSSMCCEDRDMLFKEMIMGMISGYAKLNMSFY